MRSRTIQTFTARCGGLVLLGSALVAVPTGPHAVAAPPTSVNGKGVGHTITLSLGEPQMRRAGTGGSATALLRPGRFAMVAITWRGADPHAEVRTRHDGRWSTWRALEPFTDGPDPGTAEDAGGPAAASQALWVGDAEGVQLRTARRSPRSLKLVLIDPGELPSDRRAAGVHGRATQPRLVRPTASAPAAYRTATVPAAAGEVAMAAGSDGAPRPRLFSRRDWGADNSLRNGEPSYLTMIKQVHLHHTVSNNRYSRGDVPRMIRGMYRYHTQTLGWFDIGYNFLVDKFGRAWVGRSGGHWRRVQGAHTRGFNHASTGIALIGANRKWEKARWKIGRLAAWKLDREGRNADRLVKVTSRGSDLFPRGARVRLPAMDGHRDTNQTACPGNRLYGALPELRKATQRRIDNW